MPINPTALHVEEDHLDFAWARQFADRKAKGSLKPPCSWPGKTAAPGVFLPMWSVVANTGRAGLCTRNRGGPYHDRHQ